MLNSKTRGSSLVEVLIASVIGTIVVLAVQQQLQWQSGLQHRKVSRVSFLLSAQAAANQFFETLKNTTVTRISNPQDSCYLFPQRNGGSVGFRVRNKQLQHNSMTLDCAGYGWQSLTDKSQFKVTQLTAYSYTLTSGRGLSKLFITFTVTRDGQTQTFKRLITPGVS